jgi:hypothetical protein
MCLDQPYGFYVVAAVLVTALNKAVMLALVDTSLFARWLCLCSLGQLAWSRLLCTKLAEVTAIQFSNNTFGLGCTSSAELHLVAWPQFPTG